MNLLVAILIWLSIGYITGRAAEKRGRNLITWFVLGMLFGLFALLAVFLLPPINQPSLIAVADESEDAKEPFLDLHADWFYLDRENRQKGPVAFEDLAVVWHDGIVKSETYVWCEGMDEWKQIQDLPDLLEGLQKFNP